MAEIDNDENKNLIDDHEEATTGMEEIDGFDFDRAMKLMSVMEKVANVAPKATSIAGLAAAALEEMHQEAKDIAKRRVDKLKELERKRDEKLAAEQKERDAKAAAEAEEAQQLNIHPQPPEVKPRAIPSAPASAAPNGRRV